MDIAVIDNDALVNLFNLSSKHPNLFNSLRSLFNRIHIPMRVSVEFMNYHGMNLAKRQLFIQQLRIDRGFIRLCNRFDIFNTLYLTTLKGVDDGEREVIAQKHKVSAYWIISDDTKFTQILQEYDSMATVINSLHLVALLEINGYYSNCKQLKKDLCDTRPFNKRQLKEALAFIANHLSISLSRQQKQRFLNY